MQAKVQRGLVAGHREQPAHAQVVAHPLDRLVGGKTAQCPLDFIVPAGAGQAPQAVPQAGDALEAGHFQVQGAFQLTHEAARLVADAFVQALLLDAFDLPPQQHAGAAQDQ